VHQHREGFFGVQSIQDADYHPPHRRNRDRHRPELSCQSRFSIL
jgi:hypothetical protein